MPFYPSPENPCAIAEWGEPKPRYAKTRKVLFTTTSHWRIVIGVYRSLFERCIIIIVLFQCAYRVCAYILWRRKSIPQHTKHFKSIKRSLRDTSQITPQQLFYLCHCRCFRWHRGFVRYFFRLALRWAKSPDCTLLLESSWLFVIMVRVNAASRKPWSLCDSYGTYQCDIDAVQSMY